MNKANERVFPLEAFKRERTTIKEKKERIEQEMRLVRNDYTPGSERKRRGKGSMCIIAEREISLMSAIGDTVSPSFFFWNKKFDSQSWNIWMTSFNSARVWLARRLSTKASLKLELSTNHSLSF